jgi:hypothetical protein
MLPNFKGNGLDPIKYNIIVATLALGSQLMQRLARMWAKREAHESHFMLPGMQKSVRE